MRPGIRWPFRQPLATMWMPSPVEVRRPIMAAIGFSAIFIGDIPSGHPRITYFTKFRDSGIDHYAMLIFAAAVIIMGPALGMAYSELLPYATPGFVAFGAGSLITGWLGDRWSRRHMMVIFFIGIGVSMISVGFVSSPLQLGAALLAIGLFASIYHPVGTAMIVSYADKLGAEMGINGVWGNLGVASSALVTGVIGADLGWGDAFFLSCAVCVVVRVG